VFPQGLRIVSITFKNAALLHIDPPLAAPGGLRVSGDAIDQVGPDVTPQPGDEIIDCGGALLLPGLVNGHTHLYSVLAAGMPPPPRQPKNFHEILQLIWWRLDRALDAASIETSATIGALDALRCGTTTLIDHHASPNFIVDSLDVLQRGVDAVGLRTLLSYETTDRNGLEQAAAGLAENRRYLDRCRRLSDCRHAAMVGAHAAFTLGDESLAACVKLAVDFQTGLHIHVAEDPCDDDICRRGFGAPLIDRLRACGFLDPDGGVAGRSILAHCTHLAPADARDISRIVGAVAHNPRSNMNNQVGYAPIAHLSGVQLGTDGIGGDLFTESKCAFFMARHARLDVAPDAVVAMLAQSARTAGRILGMTLGKLQRAAAADLVLTDHIPPVPLDGQNAAAYLLFALGPQHIRDVLIAGRWALRNRVVVGLDEPSARAQAVDVTRALSEKMGSL